jgi:hypothetical protein
MSRLPEKTRRTVHFRTDTSESRIDSAPACDFDGLSRLRQAIEQPDPNAGGKGRAERGRVCRLR